MTPEAKSLHVSRAVTPSEIRSVQGLFQEYGGWVRTLSSLADHDPTIRNLESEIASLPGIYAPPSGCLLLATHHGQPAGCFALRPHEGGTGELKRLYVRPGSRGLHIGRELVTSAIAAAREAGYRRLILDSHVAMTSAHALYRAAGFRRVATPAGFSEALRPVIVFMEMEIEPGAPGKAAD